MKDRKAAAQANPAFHVPGLNRRFFVRRELEKLEGKESPFCRKQPPGDGRPQTVPVATQ